MSFYTYCFMILIMNTLWLDVSFSLSKDIGQSSKSVSESKTQVDKTVTRVKRMGGNHGSSGGGGGGSLGTKVTISTGSSTTMNPLTILLGAKALILKGILIKNLINQQNQPPPVMTSVNSTTTATDAPAAGGRRLRSEPISTSEKEPLSPSRPTKQGRIRYGFGKTRRNSSNG